MLGGTIRHANSVDPSIPGHLAPLVGGIVSLNNIPRQAMHSGVRPRGQDSSDYDDNLGAHELSPADFATIYDVNPLYGSGVNGSGQIVAIVGRTHPPATNWATFRSAHAAFALPIRPT